MQLSMFAYSLASLQLRDEALLSSMARQLQAKFSKCNILEATLIVNAYARLLMVERTVFGQLMPSFVAAHGRRFHAKDIARTLNAYAKVQLRSTTVFDALAERCADQVAHMDCHALSVVANAHARLLVANQALFEVMAKRLQGCVGTCTLQAVSNLLNAYSKFSFGGPGSSDFTNGVIDCLVAELPRFEESMTTQSLCVMAHAAARAGHHLRRPEVSATLGSIALRVGLENFTSSQLGMLAVAFAEMDAARGGERGEASGATDGDGDLWAALATIAAERRAELEAADASNVALAFASTRLDAEKVAALDLARHCQDTPPTVASALLVAHALERIHDGHLTSLISAQVPDFLWQATETLACRLALALQMVNGQLPSELRRKVEGYVVRTGGGIARRDASDATALRSACQGFAAVASPSRCDLKRYMQLGPSSSGAPPRLVWLEVAAGSVLGATHATGPSFEERWLPGSQFRLPGKLTSAGRHLAAWLAQEHRGHGHLLLRIARSRPRSEAESGSGGSGGASFALRTLEAALAESQGPTMPGHGIGGLAGGQSGFDLAATDEEARAPDLAVLLLPGVAPRPLAATPVPARQLARGLRRFGLRTALPVRAPPLLADLGALLPLGDGTPPVPVAFLVDDERAFLRSFESGATDEPQSAGLSFEAALHGFLLALGGWMVVRVRAEEVSALLAGEGAARRLYDGLRETAARWAHVA